MGQSCVQDSGGFAGYEETLKGENEGFAGLQLPLGLPNPFAGEEAAATNGKRVSLAAHPGQKPAQPLHQPPAALPTEEVTARAALLPACWQWAVCSAALMQAACAGHQDGQEGRHPGTEEQKGQQGRLRRRPARRPAGQEVSGQQLQSLGGPPAWLASENGLLRGLLRRCAACRVPLTAELQLTQLRCVLARRWCS